MNPKPNRRREVPVEDPVQANERTLNSAAPFDAGEAGLGDEPSSQVEPDAPLTGPASPVNEQIAPDPISKSGAQVSNSSRGVQLAVAATGGEDRQPKGQKADTPKPPTLEELAHAGDIDQLMFEIQHSPLGQRLLPRGLGLLQRAIEVASQKDSEQFGQEMLERAVGYSASLLLRCQLLMQMCFELHDRNEGGGDAIRLLSQTLQAASPQILALQRHHAQLVALQVHINRELELTKEKRVKRLREGLRPLAAAQHDFAPGSSGATSGGEPPAEQPENDDVP